MIGADERYTGANRCGLILAGNYWVVNQILSKGLHNSDEECLKYTTGLMDKLEKVRSARPTVPSTYVC